MKPLIIGQAPARGNDGLLPFAGKSGARLAKLAGVGTSGDDLPEHFDLLNLLPRWPGKAGKGDNFPYEEAAQNAKKAFEKLKGRPPTYILMMGNNVTRCFGLQTLRYLESHKHARHVWIKFPHPSGVNRWFNDPDNVRRAEKVMDIVLARSRGR